MHSKPKVLECSFEPIVSKEYIYISIIYKPNISTMILLDIKIK